MHLLLSFLPTLSLHALLPQTSEQQLSTSRHIWSSLVFRFPCSVPVELNQPAGTQRWTRLWLLRPLSSRRHWNLFFSSSSPSFSSSSSSSSSSSRRSEAFRKWSWFVGWCSPLCDPRGSPTPRSYRSSPRVCEPKKHTERKTYSRDKHSQTYSVSG